MGCQNCFGLPDTLYYQSDCLPHSNLDTRNPQDLDCISVLLCIAGCDPEDAECSYTCGMIGLENQPFLDISQCMADLGCLPTYPDDGTCLAEDADALQVASSVELLGDITSSLPILRGKVKVGFVSYILRVPYFASATWHKAVGLVVAGTSVEL